MNSIPLFQYENAVKNHAETIKLLDLIILENEQLKKEIKLLNNEINIVKFGDKSWKN